MKPGNNHSASACNETKEIKKVPRSIDEYTKSTLKHQIRAQLILRMIWKRQWKYLVRP